MSKFILELKDDVQVVQKVGVTENGNAFVMNFYKDQLEELNSDYINENFSDLQDDAYNKGYAQCQDDYGDALKHAKDTAYKKGFEDGKAVHDKGCEGCKWAGMTGQPPCIQCSNNYPNVWQKQDDKIEVGDEVRHKEYKNRFVVTKMQDGHAYGISKDGSWNNFRNDGSIVKTGRHFDIQSILEAMQK